MIVCYIICGISICLSVWTVWRAQKNKQAIKLLIEMSQHFDNLYQTVNHILDYLIGDNHDDGEEEGLR